MEYKIKRPYLELIIDHSFTDRTIEDLLLHYKSAKKLIHQMRMSHDVYLNDKGVEQNFNIRLKLNDKLRLPVFIDEEPDFLPENLPLDILYEDDFLLIVNKESNIEVHPDNKDGLHTLANAVSFYYQKTNQLHRIRYIHRLDKDTSGAIVFVKNYFTHNLYDYLLMNKEIKRYYMALVTGKLTDKVGIINKKIGRDRHHNQRRIISKTGDEAKTAYKLIKQYNDYALVELELFTGRTHQIRVHMASINCPLLGDELYGEKSTLINRQALHAHRIELIHPVTLKRFTVNAPIPDDMKKLL